MLATQSGQVGMFNAAALVRPLPEGSFFGLLAECGDRIVRDEDFAECYSSRMGRPSIPPSQLAKVLLLQHRTGVSDEQRVHRLGGCVDGIRESARLLSTRESTARP